MEDIRKLELELVELNDLNISKIFEYLKTLDSSQINLNNEEKTLKQMYKYICNKARTMATNSVAVIDDRIVYVWARIYFNKSNEELGLIEKEVEIDKAKKIVPAIKEENDKKSKDNTSEQISILEGL